MSETTAHFLTQHTLGAPACPVCSASDVRIVESHNGQRLMKCRRCSLAYLSPPPADSDVAAHFQATAATQSEREQKFENNREPVLAQVADYIRKNKRAGDILDVGCATGFFLKLLCSGTSWRPWGVELSRNFARQAESAGIRVYYGDVFQAALPEEFFDVITVLDAFYYFPRPQATLREFRRILKPDGLLLLELPAGGSRVWRKTGKLGRFMSGTRSSLLTTSDHLFYYTPPSITLLMQQSEFNVQEMRLLPGNRQANRRRDYMYKSFYYFSQALAAVSGSRVFLGPRFLVAAVKSLSPAQNQNYVDKSS